MGTEVSQAYRIAIAAVVMAFLISTGLVLMTIGRNFWNRTADAAVGAAVAVQDNDAFFLASYNKPVPVAAVYRLTERINSNLPDTAAGNGNFATFYIKEQSDANPNDFVLKSTSLADLDAYMSRKAYVSWSVDDTTNLYSMEVLVVK